MSNGIRSRWLSLVAGTLLVALPAAASPLFRLTDLGTAGRVWLDVAINGHGIVCGSSQSPDGDVPTIFDHGKVMILRPFPDSSLGGFCSAINDTGQAAGSAFDAQGIRNGFLWDGKGYTILPTLGGQYTDVRGMNALGEVVGESEVAPGVTHAFAYEEGTIVDLGTIEEGNDSTAMGVNATGDITGFAPTGFITSHAFLYRHGRMHDLGDLGGGTNSQGFAINDKGQIAALVWPSNAPPYSVITHKGKVKVIPGPFEAEPTGINSRGHVVGFAMDSLSPWFYDGEKSYLLQDVVKGASGWQLQSTVVAVNDADSIASTAINVADGLRHTVLLTRVK